MLSEEQEDSIIQQALSILERRIYKSQDIIDNPEEMKRFLTLQFAQYEFELFGVVFIDNIHRVIAIETLFRGTLAATSIYPREVVKAALKHNAAAVVLYHNHPSGSPEPSPADIKITERLSEALKLVDIQVLDHIVVGGAVCVSFAEKGLL